jgi:transcriptional regulator with XRE-family HTH domain
VKLTRLRELRERKLLTQDQLAERAGLSRAAIAAIEKGDSEPRPDTIRKLANALDLEDPTELMPPLTAPK